MKKILTLIILTLSMVSFSQNVTVSIENLKANNVTVPNGSPIDMGNNSSINVTFRVDLAKSSSYTIGPAKVWISVFNSSGNRTDHFITTVPESEFTTGASANYDFDILDSEIDFGNGNYLMATLKQDNQPGAEWDSQQVPIIKTPAFELSPSSLSLPCGDTSPRTFTVTNSSNLSGVTYQWNIGNGWTGNVGNGSSITITPNSGTVLPSDVSVTPIYNGENQPTLTCNVNRASFTSSLTISGSNMLCSSSNYSVDTSGTNIEVIGWSISNTNIATIIGNGNQATLTAMGNGVVDIFATLSNVCGQTTNIVIEDVVVGKPTVNSPYHIQGGYDNVSVNSVNNFNVNQAIGATQYYWFITTINTSCGGLSTQDPPRFYNYSTNSYSSTLTTPYPTATIDWGECPGSYVVNCRAVNSCGTSDYTYRAVEVYGYGDIPCDQGPTDPYGKSSVKIYPNPVKGGSFTVNKLPPELPCNNNKMAKQKSEFIINDVTIMDFQGNVVYNNSFNTDEFTIDGLNLKQGIYILNISSSDGETTRKIITVE